MQESIVATVPYPTHPRGGRYCLPKDSTLENKVLSDNKALGPWSHNRLLTVIGTLQHLYWLLLAAAGLSLLLGYVFIFAIKNCPFTLAKVFLYPLTLLMILFTAWWLAAIGPLINKDTSFSQWYVPRNDLFKQWDFNKACYASIALGCFTCSLALAMFGVTYNYTSIGITDLMNCSFETFKAIPNMTAIPIAEGISKFIVFWIGLHGFSVFASEGWIEKNRIHVNGARFAGLSRDYIPSIEDIRFWFMCAVWLFLVYWMMEFCTAMGQFITTYCTFKYFGIKKEGGKKPPLKPGVICDGLKLALIYHPGSILRGALLTPLYRPVRILQWITAEFSTGQQSGSFLMKIVACCPCGWICQSIYACTKDCLKEGDLKGEEQDVPCKDAISDVVIRANDFERAAPKAHYLLEHSHKLIQYLYRDHSQTTINLIGVCSIASITSCAVYLLVANLDMYKESISPLFVADPFLATFLTWILSAYVTFGFMTLWDHTADTLLYCYAWHRRWNRKTVNNYCPETLRFIVGHDDQEDDRYPYYGKAKNQMYLRTYLPMVGMSDPKAKKKAAPKDSKKK